MAKVAATSVPAPPSFHLSDWKKQNRSLIPGKEAPHESSSVMGLTGEAPGPFPIDTGAAARHKGLMKALTLTAYK
ncbi:hypothetical protein RJP68_23940, partial [Escherichia coli]|nr:hypothetical protein [Escherichia coli]